MHMHADKCMISRACEASFYDIDEAALTAFWRRWPFHAHGEALTFGGKGASRLTRTDLHPRGACRSGRSRI